MASGMILRDENGNIIADYTTKMGRYLGYMDIPQTNGSISPAGSEQGTLFAMVVSSDEQLSWGDNRDHVTVTVTSTTISWSWPSGTGNVKNNYSMIYGVY